MRDFASFLNESPEPPARPAPEALDEGSPAPSIPFGFVAGSAAQSVGGGTPEFLSTYLGLNADRGAERGAALPETAPDAIARELALHRVADMKSLDRLRREFAFGNHPDRVRPEWRDRAMARMQTANRLIDEAKQRLAGRRG